MSRNEKALNATSWAKHVLGRVSVEGVGRHGVFSSHQLEIGFRNQKMVDLFHVTNWTTGKKRTKIDMKFDILIDNTEVNTHLLAIHDQRSSGSYHFKFHSTAMTAACKFHVNLHFLSNWNHITKQKRNNEKTSQNTIVSKYQLLLLELKTRWNSIIPVMLRCHLSESVSVRAVKLHCKQNLLLEIKLLSNILRRLKCCFESALVFHWSWWSRQTNFSADSS